jgi:hypothetical protein
MFQAILWLAQFAYIIWPLLVITALFYAFPGRGGLRGIAKRAAPALGVVWALLFLAWLLTRFAGGPLQPLLATEPLNTILFLGGFVFFTLGGMARALKLTPNRLANYLAGRANARISMYDAARLEDLFALQPAQFEELVAETYRALGYTAKVSGKSGDHGVDIYLTTENGHRWIVQCKRYRDPVGEEVVRGLYGSLMHERAEHAILVTTADITPPAERWARGKAIDLVDGPRFLRMIAEASRRMQPDPLDRLARTLQAWFNPKKIPPALRTTPGASSPGPASTTSLNPSGNGRLQGDVSGIRMRVVRTTIAEQPVSLPVPGQTLPIQQRVGSIRPALSGKPYISSPPPAQPLTRPVCPRCGIPMNPRPARPMDPPGRVLYRCQNYPACRVTLEAK